MPRRWRISPEQRRPLTTAVPPPGTVLQGYVGSQVPASVVQTAPGVQGVGTAVLNVLAQNHKVTQADVNAINEAAAIEAAASAPATTGTSAH